MKEIALRRMLHSIPFLLLCVASIVHADELKLDADIEVTVSSDVVQMKPNVQANQDIALRYKLITYKCGAAGTSKNANTGSIQLKKGEKKSVGSTLTFQSFAAKDYVEMTLKLYKEKQLVAEFSKSYPEDNSCE